MRRWWRSSRLPVLLLLGTYVAAVVAALDSQLSNVDHYGRSIDIGGFDNNIEDDASSMRQRQHRHHQHQQQNANNGHPHGMPGKPSKLDLDVAQYTETDDEAMFELERERLQAESEMTTMPASTTTTTTEATAASAETRCDGARSKGASSVKCMEKRLESFLRTASSADTLNVSDSVQIVRRSRGAENNGTNATNATGSLVDEIGRFAREHVLEIKLSKGMFSAREARTFFGAEFQAKNTFLTGFGLGFLAFGLKKLLLPLFIGVQIIKSILIALFLPSIIGSIGKIVGKGVTSFAQSSQNQNGQPFEENYEFKDNQELFGDDYMQRQPLGTLPASAMYDESMLQQAQQTSQAGVATANAVANAGAAAAAAANKEIASRFAFVDPRLTAAHSMQTLSDRYYTRHVVNPQPKRQDFKVFHEIPTSSLLLTNYDPFYSPLLSRLDAVFSRLGHNTEGCREYAVCAMYRSPARYAPYSNLVSAQLSRELNELRKPSSDNPDVLRFFRYMKAAKDGQDGVRCEDAYADCEGARDDQTIRQNQAMLATYQDIDKLVHARKL